jgi:radical SAM superfamily enzyme YgiQ (UPF0313 family)
MTRALLVYPEFRSASFWNYREPCKLLDAQVPTAPLGLCTVAALLPSDWEMRLIDRNVEKLTDADLEWADIVLTGGMMPQQQDCFEVINRAVQRGKRVVVGGPDATSSPHHYSQATHLVLDEGELTLPDFLEDLKNGCPKPIYRDSRKADVQKSPTPRFDLLRFDRYTHIGVQWCRGCPFNCEFCDIIELFGRVPRTKSIEQMLRELQRLYDLGYRGHVDVVDDNFIGNKKLVKEFLPHLQKWQQERDWPFEFSTEATINLADDPVLMRLMRDTGFFAIFVGIESPDETTLVGMQKLQNTRRHIVESIHKIYAQGMFVNAGFIVGFDEERDGVAPNIIKCIEEAGMPVNMTGLLFALPMTQMTRRLAREGRLHEDFDILPGGDDQFTAGLNFDTCRPRAEILNDYLNIVETVYAADNYFKRVLKVGLLLDSSHRPFQPSFRRLLKELKGFWRLIMKLGLPRETRQHFWRVLLNAAWNNPRSIRYTASLMALYLHFGPFSKYVAQSTREAIAKEKAVPSKVAVPRLAARAAGGAL